MDMDDFTAGAEEEPPPEEPPEEEDKESVHSIDAASSHATAVNEHADAYDELGRLRRHIADLEEELSEEKERGKQLEFALGMTGPESDRISFQGFLKKKTPSRVVGRDYDRRWFVIHGHHLRYYEEKGNINIEDPSVLDITASEKDPVSFFLNAPNMHRKFELKCDSPEDRDRWMSALQGVPPEHVTELSFDVERIERQEAAQRQLIEAHENTRRQFFTIWKASEEHIARKREEDAERIRQLEGELEALKEQLQATEESKALYQEATEANTESLNVLLRKEQLEREVLQSAASGFMAKEADKLCQSTYYHTWRRWLLGRHYAKLTDKLRATEQEKLRLAGRLSDAQDNGERFMLSHHASKRHIEVLLEDLGRRGIYIDWSNTLDALSLWETRERKDVEIGSLRSTVMQLTAQRDDLQRRLDDTMCKLGRTSEMLRVRTNECQQLHVAEEERCARRVLESECLRERFAILDHSVRKATMQREGGRVLCSMHDWDRNGGLVWRRIYLWLDANQHLINYSHRDRRWGEVESLRLQDIEAVEVEAFDENFGSYPSPEIAGHERIGFYIEMRSGAKHRFCAESVAERMEWLETLRTLVLEACYPVRPASPGAAPSSLPAKPAQPGGSPWAAIPGGGAPSAAAAATIKPGSPRRVRARVCEAGSPGARGHPVAPEPASPQRTWPRM